MAGCLGGCAQVVGIDNTQPAGNSIRLVRTSIGTKVVQEPIDLDGLSATYFVSGGDPASVARVAATAGDRGQWITRLRTPAPVQVTLPDVPAPLPRVYDLPSQHLQASFDVLEHPGRAPAPDGAMLGVTVPLDAPPATGEVFQIYVVGAWLALDLAPTAFTVVDNAQLVIQPFGVTAMTNLAQRPQPDRMTAQDAFLVLRYANSQLTGVAEATPFDQTDQAGMATSVTTFSMMPVATVQTFDVKIAVSAMVARYAKVQPAATMPATTNWALSAAPGYGVTSTAGPLLQKGKLDLPAVGLRVAYGNPFVARDWRTCFTLRSAGSRTFVLPGTTSPATLEAGFIALTEPPPAGGEIAVSAGMSAAIPLGITFNRTLLSTDGLEIKQPTGFVDVSVSLDQLPDAPGTARYFLLVQELVPGPGMAPAVRHLALSAVSAEPRFSLPPEVFQAGHLYTLQAIATLGAFHGSDAGDLVTRSLPLTEGFLDSAVIVVTP